jgi:hypothetical protein
MQNLHGISVDEELNLYQNSLQPDDDVVCCTTLVDTGFQSHLPADTHYNFHEDEMYNTLFQ